MSIVNPYAKKRKLQDPTSATGQDPCRRPAQHVQAPTSPLPTTKSDPDDKDSSNQQPGEDVSALVISASNKAGMDGIDRTRIDAIILRESGNSLFMQQQRKRDERVNDKIQQMKVKLQQYQQQHQQATIPTTNPQIEQELASYHRFSRSTAVVIDMDMFFMACELLTRPELHNKPACVGKGMISTSNYVARKYGVRSAMPGFIADKLVDELSGGKERLVHVSSNYALYKEKSRQVRDVLAEFDPFSLRAYSLDEAFLELGPYLAVTLQHPTWSHEQILNRLRPRAPTKASLAHNVEQEGTTAVGELTKSSDTNSSAPSLSHAPKDAFINDQEEGKLSQECSQPSTTAHSCYYREHFRDILEKYPCELCLRTASRIVSELRRCVQLRTGGLTCSAGVAPNFMVAKIASDRNKPNGQCLIDPGEILDFVHALPTRKIPGIGRVTAKLLQAFDIATVQELYNKRGLVHILFQPTTAKFLLRASVGCDSSSSSTSYFNDTSDNIDNDEDSSSSSTAKSSSATRKQQKGISRERTFSSDQSWAQLNTRLEDIARNLSNDMVKKGVMAHTITVKVKLHTFDVLSKARSMAPCVYVQSAQELVSIATELFQEVKSLYLKKTKDASSLNDKSGGNSVPHRNTFACRLLGIRCSNLVAADAAGKLSGNQLVMDRYLAKADIPATNDSQHLGVRAAVMPQSDTCRDSDPSSVVPKIPSPYNKKQRSTLQKPSPKKHKQEPSASAKTLSLACHVQDEDIVHVPASTRGIQIQKASSEQPATTTDTKLTHEEQNLKITTTENTEMVHCPLCSQPISADDNDALNRHIDSCLNASTVRQAVREESFTPSSTTYSATSTKKRRLVDFWKS